MVRAELQGWCKESMCFKKLYLKGNRCVEIKEHLPAQPFLVSFDCGVSFMPHTCLLFPTELKIGTLLGFYDTSNALGI